MKIKRNASRLTEADDVATKADVVDAAADSRDIQSATTDEIADTIQATAEVQTGEPMSDEAAKAAAIEAEQIAKKLEIESFESLVTDNAVTRALNMCWRTSKTKREGKMRPHNLLVTGLPGSGKTAIVQSWCDANKLRCVYIDAKNRDLPSALTGIPLRDTSSETVAIDMAYSKFLDRLDKSAYDEKHGIVGTVMFLDELNRAKEDIRGSLLGLINEHKVQGGSNADGDGYRHFDFLKFTVACINPYIQGVDQGASKLNLAELSRFATNIDYDSNNKDALAFYESKYHKLFKRLENNWKGTDEQIEEYVAYTRKLNLATALLANAMHKFDGSGEFDDDGLPFYAQDRDDIDKRSMRDTTKMQSIAKWGFNMWNQRLMTSCLVACDGTKDSFLKEVKYSKLAPTTWKMINDILRTYKDTPVEMIDLPESPETDDAAAEAPVKAPANPESDEIEEKDVDIANVAFGGRDVGTIKSKADILQDINTADIEAELDSITL